MRPFFVGLVFCLACPPADPKTEDDTVAYEPFNGGVDTGGEAPTGTAMAATPAPPEASCEARAPEARLACTFAARAREAMPEAAVTVAGPDLVRIDDQEVAMDPLRAICEQADRCDDRMADWIAALAEARAAEKTPATAEQLRPVLKHRAFVEEIRRSSPELAALAEPFVGDVHVVLVVDFPRVTRALTPADLEHLTMTVAQAHERAIANLREYHGDLPIEAMPNDLRVLGPTDGYAAARLLLHDQWAAVARSTPGGLVVAPCNRDLVILGDPRRLEALREASIRAYRYVDHPITDALWRYTARGWVPLEDPAEPSS